VRDGERGEDALDGEGVDRDWGNVSMKTVRCKALRKETVVRKGTYIQVVRTRRPGWRSILPSACVRGLSICPCLDDVLVHVL
jgi:hypothetical protein